MEKFKYYVRQDYPFLLEFARCLALASAKAPDLETMRTFSSLLGSSLTLELKMLENLAGKLGIQKTELQKSEASPTNMAYTRHLLYVAYSGTEGEILASMLPCIWSYQEISDRISDLRGLNLIKYMRNGA